MEMDTEREATRCSFTERGKGKRDRMKHLDVPRCKEHGTDQMRIHVLHEQMLHDLPESGGSDEIRYQAHGEYSQNARAKKMKEEYEKRSF